MDTRRVGAAAAVVGVISTVVWIAPAYVRRWFVDALSDGFWRIGTVGETFALYTYLTSIGQTIALMGFAVGLGYYVGRDVDLAAEYRRFLGVVFAGGMLGVFAIFGLVGAWGVLQGRAADPDLMSIAMLVLGVLQVIMDIVLQLTIGAFAGAALARFRGGWGDGLTPTPEVSAVDAEEGSSDDERPTQAPN